MPLRWCTGTLKKGTESIPASSTLDMQRTPRAGDRKGAPQEVRLLTQARGTVVARCGRHRGSHIPPPAGVDLRRA
eukprot:6621689-Prymnesium_polylepis.1